MTDHVTYSDGQEDVSGNVQTMTFPGAIAHAISLISQGDYFGHVLLGTALKAQSTRQPQTTPPID